jgi:biotin transport system ATP-binding protein
VPTIELRRAVVDLPVPGGSAPRRLLGPVDLVLTERRTTVIGANGSGKSTLLRLLNGLERPSAGTVTVDGHDCVRDGAAVRRRVAFAFTDPLSQLVMPTGREDVELSLRRSHRNARARRAAGEAALDRLGLGELGDQSIHDLSGGERQLMALAAVLATDPQVLVLDEPTTLLDLRNTQLLRDRLATLPQMLVIATHDLEFAREADRTLVVDTGQVVFDGLPGPAIDQYRRLAGP